VDDQNDLDDVEEGATEGPLPSVVNRTQQLNRGEKNKTRIKTVVNKVSTNMCVTVTNLTCAVE
jgi:hypothetical protein